MSALLEQASKRAQLAPYFCSDQMLTASTPVILERAVQLADALASIRFEELKVWTGDYATRIYYTFDRDDPAETTIYLSGYQRSPKDPRRWVSQHTCSRCLRMPCVHIVASYLVLREIYQTPPANDESGPQAPARLSLSSETDRWFKQFVDDSVRDIISAGELRIQIATGVGNPGAEGFVIRPILLVDAQNPLRVLEGSREERTLPAVDALPTDDRALLEAVWSGDRCTAELRGWRHASGVGQRTWLRRAIEAGKVVPTDPMASQRVLDPLSVRPTVPLSLSWSIGEHLAQQPEFPPPTPRHVLVDINGPAWLSWRDSDIQWIDANARQVQACRNAPRVPASMAAAFRERWLATDVLADLPAPVDVTRLEPSDARPTPILRIDRVERGFAAARNGAIPQEMERIDATLLMQYDAHRFERFAHPLIALTPKPVLYRHDRDVLEQASRQVEMAGHFVPRESRDQQSQWSRAGVVVPGTTIGQVLHELMEQLHAAGVRVELAEPLASQFAVASSTYSDCRPAGPQWFDLDVGVLVDDERISILPLIQHVLDRPGFEMSPAPDESADASELVPLPDGRTLRIPRQQLRDLIQPILEWMHLIGGDAEKPLRVSKMDLVRKELEGATPQWQGPQSVRALCADLTAAADPGKALTLPPEFTGTLRDYQAVGVRWLQALKRNGFGGLLADDMGLGKTVQVLAYIACCKAEGQPGPALVVCPTSVVPNWCSEAERFTPHLRVLSLQGQDRAEHFDHIGEYDLVVTTYPLLWRDVEALKQVPFFFCALDEANNLKNSKTLSAAALRQLQIEMITPVTGTPIENHLHDCWSLMSMAVPGLLGDAKQFQQSYKAPIEREANADRAAQLRRVLAPFILRRRKEEVAKELPPKTNLIVSVDLGEQQRAVYESIRATVYERVRNALETQGLAKSHVLVLDAITKLRQVCCDPRLLKLAHAQQAPSAKLDHLVRMVSDMVREGRRVLLFSQFTSMLSLIGQAMTNADIPFVTLTGQTRDRATPVAEFTAGKVPLFLISLKAGGAGLNLTTADTVILYDPWWNPATEQQAADRAYRIGQTKPVFVYQLVCASTIEDVLIEMQQRKAKLAASILDGGDAALESLTEGDIERLFAAPTHP